MPSIVQSINDFEFEPTPEDILSFLVKRYDIANTDDYILKHSRFLNVFRENDAVSRVVNEILLRNSNATNHHLARVAIICRLVNHRDCLPILFERGSSFLQTPQDHRYKMEEFTQRDGVVCNPAAYQINPRIGFDHGHRNIRDTMVHKLPAVLDSVSTALISTNKIDKATDAANKAFGGFANFWMFQAAIDISWHRPEVMDPYSKPYLGSGSKNAVIDMEMLRNYLNNNRPASWREFYPYDVENALCEFRKYKMRQEKGIPNNRRYSQ